MLPLSHGGPCPWAGIYSDIRYRERYFDKYITIFCHWTLDSADVTWTNLLLLNIWCCLVSNQGFSVLTSTNMSLVFSFAHSDMTYTIVIKSQGPPKICRLSDSVWFRQGLPGRNRKRVQNGKLACHLAILIPGLTRMAELKPSEIDHFEKRSTARHAPVNKKWSAKVTFRCNAWISWTPAWWRHHCTRNQAVARVAAGANVWVPGPRAWLSFARTRPGISLHLFWINRRRSKFLNRHLSAAVLSTLYLEI